MKDLFSLLARVPAPAGSWLMCATTLLASMVIVALLASLPRPHL